MAEIINGLCNELGYKADSKKGPVFLLSQPSSVFFGEPLSAEKEELLATARLSLAHMATAVGAMEVEGLPNFTIATLLDGAEWVMRRELASGNPLLPVMPSFIFLVTLSALSQDEALALSERASELFEEAFA